MHHMTIRNIDPAVKTALEERARAEAISQSEAARRALARGLGVRIARRDLAGLGREMLDATSLDALGQVDWEAPDFADADLDAMMSDEDARTRGPAPHGTGTPGT